MNNIIKSLIIILSFSSRIFAQELIITIPDQFLENEFPLPPFPQEAISELDEVAYDSSILSSDEVRQFDLTEISYLYYPEFLEFNIGDNIFIDHTAIFEAENNGVKLSYLATFKNNNFLLNSGIGFNTDGNILDLTVDYHEFRLPLSLILKGSLEDKDLALYVGKGNYYKRWGFEQGLSGGELFAKVRYIDDTGVKPLIDLGFKNIDDLYLNWALGYEKSRLGFSVNKGNLFPYIESDGKFNNVSYRFKTDTDYDYIDYNLNLKLDYFDKLTLGPGVIFDNGYNSINPYFRFKDSYILGSREYIISLEYLNFEFSFINDNITSIISLNYPYDYSEFSFDIFFSYKVGKI